MRSAWYRPLPNPLIRDSENVDALNGYFEHHPRRGFWNCYKALRPAGYSWNRKRVCRVYWTMGPNLPRRTKRRLPVRGRVPLAVPEAFKEIWSADFMSVGLHNWVRFCTFNVIDDFNREGLAIEIDTSLIGAWLIRVFKRLAAEHSLRDPVRVDNRPEFLGTEFTNWAKGHGMLIQYIQPGKPNQNTFIKCLNRTYRDKAQDFTCLTPWARSGK